MSLNSEAMWVAWVNMALKLLLDIADVTTLSLTGLPKHRR